MVHVDRQVAQEARLHAAILRRRTQQPPRTLHALALAATLTARALARRIALAVTPLLTAVGASSVRRCRLVRLLLGRRRPAQTCGARLTYQSTATHRHQTLGVRM